MSTRRQRRKKDYKYCLECGRKFKSNKDKVFVDRYEQRDCIYGTFDKSTGKAICQECYNKSHRKTYFEDGELKFNKK